MDQDYVSSDKGKKSQQCPHCYYVPSRKDSLKQHINSVHEEKKQHRCTICDFVSSYKSSLKQHIKSVHEEEKPYQCIICAYSCSAKQRLERHIDSLHGKTPVKKQKKFECPLCSTIFRSNQERLNHKKLIH